MASNPPAGTARLAPYLYYEDCPGAMAFLRDAFGFEDVVVFPAPNGGVYHAEMRLLDATIMLGRPGPDYKNPAKEGRTHAGIHVYVDDVDAHHARAAAAGAQITSAPADQFYGDRRYEVRDTEGNHWTFATHVRDVSPEEMAKAMEH